MTSPIRVLRVIARLNVGGPAVQANVLANGLDKTRFEQRLVAGPVGEDEGDYVALRAPELDVHYVDTLGRSLSAADARSLVDIRRQISSFRPHIVHTHTSKAGVLGRIAAWTAGVPITVHTFHGHHLRGYFSPRGVRAFVTVERTLAWRTSALVSVGRRVRDELVAAGIGRAERFTVVPPGVPLVAPPPRAAARAALGLPESAPVVALVARLTQVKRPDRFAEVALAVHARYPHVHFIVAGEGALLDDLRARTRELDDHIHFLGWRRDIEVVYGAADIALLVSDNEGMPVSLIEAAACGVPAVTTNVGSAEEVVDDGQTGFVVEPSVVPIVDALDKLLSDTALRTEMGNAARARAYEHFGAERLVVDIDALYTRLAAARLTGTAAPPSSFAP